MNLRLESIKAANLKGCTFQHPLAPITFFVGPNYKGKTSRADAIRLLLAGWLPELGKESRATFDLASGRSFFVEGQIGDGNGNHAIASRTWKLDGDSVRKSARIAPELGDSDLLVVMLNADEWFGLSDRDRVDWVAKNVGAPSRMARAEVDASAMASVRADDEDFDARAVDDFFAKVAAWVQAKERDEGPVEDSAYVGVLIDAGTELGKEARDHAKTMEKTAAGLAGLRAGDTPGGDLAAVDGKISAARARITALTQERATAAAALNIEKTNAGRRERLTRELAGKSFVAVKRDDLAKKLDELNSRVAALPAPETGLDDLKREERDTSNALANHKGEHGRVLESIERNETERVELATKTACPYCGAAGDGWKALKDAEIGSALAGLRAKRDQLAEQVFNLGRAAEGLRNRITGIERIAREKYDLAVDGMDLRGRLATAEAEVNAFAGKEGELAAIPAADTGVVTAYEMASSEIKVKEGEIAELESTRKALLGRQNDLKRLAEAEKARDEARVEEKIAKSAVEAARRIKSKIVEETMRPVVEAANRIFGHLMESPLAYDPSRALIGTWRDGQFIGHKTFSGVEKLVAYAAIQAALASKSKVRLMIIDELLRAKNTKKRKLFDELIAACKAAVRGGTLDNFVGILPGDPEDYAWLAGPDEKDCSIIAVE